MPRLIKEYPRVVYGPGGETKTISRKEEWPEGWLESPKLFAEEAKPKSTKASKKAEADAEKARIEAEKADAALRAELIAELNKHKVAFDEKLPTPQLVELNAQLQAHLAAQAGA
jgi:hypothetical protein